MTYLLFIAFFFSFLKHFPGFCNNVDTHTRIAIDNRSWETFVNNNFYHLMRKLMQVDQTILVSHNIVKCCK